jgi:hypothetical protein
MKAMKREARETRVYAVDGTVQVAAGTDGQGHDWYVSFNTPRGSHWLTPTEARKMARLLMRLSYKSKVKTKRSREVVQRRRSNEIQNQTSSERGTSTQP